VSELNAAIAQGLRDANAAHVAAGHDEDLCLDTAVLVAFVTVAEWAAPDGTRYLCRYEGDGSGDHENVTRWQTLGMLSYATNHLGTVDHDDA
jgi:hypothetical protein